MHYALHEATQRESQQETRACWACYCERNRLDRFLQLIPHRYTHLVLLFLLLPDVKKPKASSFQNGSGWNLAWLLFKLIASSAVQSRIFHMTSFFKDMHVHMHVQRSVYSIAYSETYRPNVWPQPKICL